MLTTLSRWCFQRPGPCLAVAFVVTLASLLVTYRHLELRTDWTHLFRPDDPVIERVEELRREFPLPHDIAVLVDGSSVERRKQFLDALAHRLGQEPELFRHSYHRLEAPFLRSSALFYLDPLTLELLHRDLAQMAPVLEAFGKDPRLQPLLESLRDRLDTPEDLERATRLLDELLAVLDEQPSTFDLAARLVPAGAPAEAGEVLEGKTVFYNRLGNGPIYYLLVQPVPTDDRMTPHAASVNRLRAIVRELRPQFPGIRARITGEPVLMSDERRTCAIDTLKSSSLSLFLVTLLFSLGFGELRRPAMAIAALAAGLLWTLGFTTITVGQLNFISVTYITMLVGLGIDFGIHLTFRYYEERQTHPALEALDRTMRGTGSDTLAGAIATAVAFLTMGLTGFRGVAELGIIAGGGVLLCFLSTVTVLPALLGLNERGEGPPPGPPQGLGLAAVEDALLRHSKLVVTLAAMGSLTCFAMLPHVRFDYNLLNIQARHLESIQTELEMIASGNTSVLTAVSLAPDLQSARDRADQFERLQTVHQVRTLADLIPAQPEAKLDLVRRLVELAAPLVPPPATPPRDEPLAVLRAMQSLREAWHERYPRLRHLPQAGELDRRIDELARVADERGPGPLLDALRRMQVDMATRFGPAVEFLKAQEARWPTLEEVPETLRVRSVGTSGVIMLRVFPAQNIWSAHQLNAFEEQLRQVDPEVSGDPLLMLRFQELVDRTHNSTVWITLGAVLLVMQLYLRNLKAVALTFLPTGLGVLWMVGVMGALDIPFNPANFVALPMLVGVGSVFGIHVVHRIREEGTPRILASSTGPAVLLSALTTMAGFGSLMTASHQGINSLGFVIATGMAANLLASLVLLPCIDQLMNERFA